MWPSLCIIRPSLVPYYQHVQLSLLASGSFGHFQASKSGVHKGGLNQPLVKAGFVATRISVRFMNSDNYVEEKIYEF